MQHPVSEHKVESKRERDSMSISGYTNTHGQLHLNIYTCTHITKKEGREKRGDNWKGREECFN